jgi:hypothetical protein
MRMAYLDEAGTSNPQHEPYTVAAGVLLNADKQWQDVERYLIDLADEYAPREKRDGFFFHATELFSGGKTFPRDKYERAERWKILDELLAIPRKFKLPIAPGWVERAKLAQSHPEFDAKMQKDYAVAVAYCIASFAIDFFMQKGVAVASDEVALLVIENNDTKPLLKSFHNFNRHPRNAETLHQAGFGLMAYKRIIGTPHFEDKTDSSALQIADACAFALKRHLMKTPESDRWYEPIKEGLILLDKNDPKALALGPSGWDQLLES